MAVLGQDCRQPSSRAVGVPEAVAGNLSPGLPWAGDALPLGPARRPGRRSLTDIELVGHAKVASAPFLLRGCGTWGCGEGTTGGDDVPFPPLSAQVCEDLFTGGALRARQEPSNACPPGASSPHFSTRSSFSSPQGRRGSRSGHRSK